MHTSTFIIYITLEESFTAATSFWNMKTQVSNNQGPASRIRKEQAMRGQHDRPNWILIAGGAVVTAVSFVIGRRQKQFFEGGVEERGEKIGKAQLANHKDGAEPAYRDPEVTEATLHQELGGIRNPKHPEASCLAESVGGTSTQPRQNGYHASNNEDLPGSAMLQGQAQLQNSWPKVEPDLPTLTLELSEEENFPSLTRLSSQEDVQPSTQQGLAAKRDMVHRLRQQLKRRDEMIFDMQAQISEHERAMSLFQSQVSDLQTQLETSRKVDFDFKREVQRLRKEWAPQSANVDTMECTLSVNGGVTQTASDVDGRNMGFQDVMTLLVSLKKLEGEVARLEHEKTAGELAKYAMSQDHAENLQKMGKLESEFEEKKKLITEKDRLLHESEQEQSKLTANLQDVLCKLEAQAKELEVLRQRNVELEDFLHHPNCRGRWSGSLELPTSRSSHEDDSPTSPEVLDSSGDHSGRVARLDASLSSRDWKPSELAESNFKTRIVSREGPEVEDSLDGIDENITHDCTDRVSISRSMVEALQKEVEKLTITLASLSKVVLEEASRLVDDIQQNGTAEDSTQKVLEIAPEQLKPEASNWIHLSQHLSFSTGAASLAQVQELGDKLEQVAKQQLVEEELAELRKHQAKIVELQQRVAKLTCASLDEVRDEHKLRAAALILGLADKLAAQEEQARKTTMEVYGLSASFELLSPVVSRQTVEESPRQLQEGSNVTKTFPQATSHTHQSSAPEDRRLKKIDSDVVDPYISFSSQEADNKKYLYYSLPTREVGHSYKFRVGASGPPASKIRRVTSSRGEEKKLYRTSSDKQSSPHEHVSRNGSHGEALGSNSPTASILHQSLQSDSNPESKSSLQGTDGVLQQASEQKSNGQSSWLTEEETSPPLLEIEQVMAVRTPNHDTFLPTFEDSSPAVQPKSPQESAGSSRRYLFPLERDRLVHEIEREVSPEYSANGVDSSAEEELTSGSSFLLPRPESAALSPFSKMMERLDTKEESMLMSSQEGSYEIMVSSFPGGVIEEEMNSTEGAGMNRSPSSESGSESRGSIDSAFNDILDNTLDDLVKVCSTLATPAGTPTSSIYSQGSDARNVHYV